MLAIRLTRTGKINAPHYRIVVQEKRSKLNGKSIDIIGHYHPDQKNKLLVLDKEKATKWIKMGAQPSDTVTNLLVKEGILTKDQKVHHFFTPGKVEEKVKEPVAEELDTPAEKAAEGEVNPEEAADTETPTEEGTPTESAEEQASKDEPAPQVEESTEVEATPEA